MAAPGWLVRAGWTHRAPGLGVLAWQAAAVTLMVCVVAAAHTIVAPWHHADDAICMVWRLCLDALVGAHGAAAQGLAWAGLVVLVVVFGRITVAAVALVRASTRPRRHTALIRLIGHHPRTMAVGTSPSRSSSAGGASGFTRCRCRPRQRRGGYATAHAARQARDAVLATHAWSPLNEDRYDEAALRWWKP